MSIRKLGFFIGIIGFILLQFVLEIDMPKQAQSVLAVAVLIATWWIMEVIPLSATALLLIVLLPVTGSLSLRQTTAAYGDPIVFLFLGGFLIALSLEKWNLHKRIALNIINLVGTEPKRIVLGFMLSGALLSMWISNTATAIMMIPIGIALIHTFTKSSGGDLGSVFAKALLLSIAYSCSIGGIATLVGTPTNAILVGIIKSLFNKEISFAGWFIIGFPIALLLLLISWWLLVNVIFKFQDTTVIQDKSLLKNELQKLGTLSTDEKRVLYVFTLAAFCWISRPYLINQFIPEVDDTIIGIAAGILLFIIPAKSKNNGLLVWEDTKELPFGILILFGGGLALAEAFKSSGLIDWFAQSLQVLEVLPILLVIFISVTLVNFLTEFTSNVATATIVLPFIASIASILGISPFGIMIATCMSASCAFMLPVATPPNAVVFASGHIKIADMVKAGFLLNIISIILISLVFYYLFPFVDSLLF